MEKILLVFSERTIQSAVQGFTVSLNDNITNKVREKLESLTEQELIEIKGLLNRLLNLLYDGQLYEMNINTNEMSLINNLTEEEKFKIKTIALYFIGRLPVKADLDILKKAYYLENNKYIKMDIAYSTFQMFDEEIELDFIKKLTTNDEYNEMIRSWTMAFFKNSASPYEYRDTLEDDWTVAKTPRINRLKINEKENPKYKKAMAYRLVDLVIMYLFIKNRGKSSLTNEEKEIINNASVDFEYYSENKKQIINDFKKKILEY